MNFARNGRARDVLISIVVGAGMAGAMAVPAVAATAVKADTVRVGSTPLNVRADAKLAAKVVGTLKNGHTFTIVCQAIGEKVTGSVRTTVAWDRLSTGAYVSDAYVLHPPKRTFKPCPRLASAATPSSPLGPIPAPKPGISANAAAFLNSVAAPARQGDKELGVPASVTLAQAILESGWGRSKLTANDKNYFGIKCFSKGPYAVGCHDYVTNECDKAGKCFSTTATFRVYKTATDSFRDHAAFLRNLKRYAKAFDYPKNPNQFAAEIHKAGYATDPNYTTKLVSLMKQYDLYRYDV